MKRFIKKNDENPKTPFMENDIVTYIDHVGTTDCVAQINIMVLDHIEPKVQSGKGDIYYKAIQVFAPNEKPYFIIASGDGSNYRSWFNHDELRKSTPQEIELLVQVMVNMLKSGVIQHDLPANVDIKNIIDEE